VFSFAEVIDSKLRYPNTALLFIEVDSSQFTSGAPKVTCKPKGKLVRVPDTYDPVSRTYGGTWLGGFKMAYTNNPAWIFYDLVLDEIYGMGTRIDSSMIDKWELYAIAQYCDQMVSNGAGGTEPRFTCNVYIQSQQDAYTVLSDLAAVFRGITFWGNEQIYVRADVPQDDVDYTYHASNVIDGLFTYGGGSYKNRYTSALVSWSDPQDHYSDTVEGVYDSALVERYNVNQMTMTAIGCTSQSEAHRRGRWALLSNARDGTVSFGVGLDGYIPLPAEIIGIADPFRAGKQNGGRIRSVSGRSVELDRPVDYSTGDRLVVNLPDGKSQTRTISAVSADKQTVTVSTSFRVAPVPGSVWAIDSDNIAIQYFRVTSIRSNDDSNGGFTIAAVQHDPDKYRYIDDGVRITPAPVTVTPISVIPAPKNIVIFETDHIEQGMTVASMNVTWDRVEGAIRYQAQWRKDNGDWINVPVTSAQGFTVQGIYTGSYDVRVRALNAQESSSPWGYAGTTYLAGKTGKPGTPQNLLASDDVVWNINVTWAFPDGSGDTAYTELQRATTDDKANPLALANVTYPATSYQHGPMPAGVRQWYRARLVDRIGNAGDWTDWVMGISSVDVSDYMEDILEQMKDTEVLKDLIENAVNSNQTIADMAASIAENADQLAAAVGATRETAEGIIQNALAIAEVTFRQSAQQGANSAQFEQLREVIATETEARVTDVTRLDAETEANAAGITEVRQALATEEEARATAVNQLTAATKTASDKADAAAGKADEAAEESAQNTAAITELDQVVTTLDSATASRFEEITGKTDTASGGVQNTSIALIQSTLANVNLQQRLSVQYGDNKAGIARVDNVMADASRAVSESLKTLDSSAGGGTSNVTDLARTLADFSQVSAQRINSMTVTMNGQTAAITTNTQALADVNGNLNAMLSIKVGVDSNGVRYAAGMGLGVQNTPSGMQSQVLFLADRFAVMSQAGGAVTLPFVIQNGQTFISQGFIGQGWIQNAMIGDYIQSNTWDGSGNVGWHINKSGYATFNNVTVRGTVYASSGSFTGTVNATDGTFSGTVRATNFIGDVANIGIGADIIGANGSAARTITFSDSGGVTNAKNIVLEVMVAVTLPQGGGSAGVSLNIAGNIRNVSIPVAAAGSGGTPGAVVVLRHAVAGLTDSSVSGKVTVTCAGASISILAPTLTITRGTGSFAVS